MRARTYWLVASAAVLLGACAARRTASESTTPWQPNPAGRVATQLAADDPRRQLVGEWEMDWRWEARRRRMRATLIIEDSLVQEGSWVRGMKATLHASFANELDFVPPCFYPERRIVGVEVSGQHVQLEFSPGCADNNLSAELVFNHTTASGRWNVWYFSTPPSAPRGSLRMRRVSPR